jgi:hypothetical protein
VLELLLASELDLLGEGSDSSISIGSLMNRCRVGLMPNYRELVDRKTGVQKLYGRMPFNAKIIANDIACYLPHRLRPQWIRAVSFAYGEVAHLLPTVC